MTTATAERSRAPFRHEALFYAHHDGFMRGTTSFLREGLAAHEPTLVVVNAEKIDHLQRELDDATGLVRYADMDDVGTNPARIIPAWRDFVDEHAGLRPFRGIGEPIWAARTPAELVECQRHESLLNLAFADTPAFRLLCPYDTIALEPAVIDEAQRSHPSLVDGGEERPSAVYRGLDEVIAPLADPLPPPPFDVPAYRFRDGSELAAVRALVEQRAHEAGLSPARVADAILAVNELAANSLRHGGGSGTLRMWSEPGALVCEVQDHGAIEDPLIGRVRPPSHPDAGRGLWTVNQLCELVQIRTSPSTGTVVRVHVRGA
jgi:anti-sigma regulatory factor (Ser/Thr protein kinase)